MVVDGIYYALGLSAGGVLVAYLSRPWFGLPLFVLALFCLYFFRDPDRTIPAGPVAVSPADGKVVGSSSFYPGCVLSLFFPRSRSHHSCRTGGRLSRGRESGGGQSRSTGPPPREHFPE